MLLQVHDDVTDFITASADRVTFVPRDLATARQVMHICLDC